MMNLMRVQIYAKLLKFFIRIFILSLLNVLWSCIFCLEENFKPLDILVQNFILCIDGFIHILCNSSVEVFFFVVKMKMSVGLRF